jgi:hypothetical protein
MFGWMDYLAPGMVAHAVLALSVVAALGLVLGSLGFRGIRLGAAGRAVCRTFAWADRPPY